MSWSPPPSGGGDSTIIGDDGNVVIINDNKGADSLLPITEVELNTNKVTDFQAIPDDIKYPSEKLVKDNLDLKADKLTTFTENNLAKISANGGYADAGLSVQDLEDLENSYINLPAYQDFTNVTGTSLTITTNANCFLENGTQVPQAISIPNLIIDNSVTVTLASDPSQYPRTSAFTSIKLISSIITASNTSQAVTLSGIPRTADRNNIRVYFILRCKRKDVPEVYDEFPKNVRLNLQALDAEGLATDDEVKALVESTQTTVTKYVNDINGLDTNNGNTEFTAYQTVAKAWADITPSGQVKILGAGTYDATHTFNASKQSIKTILEGGTKLTGTIGLVAGNTSMQFLGGKMQVTLNDASTGTLYVNGVDLSGCTLNFTGGGYKQIVNSTSTPTSIVLANLASGTGTLELNGVIGGVIPISVGTGWTVIYRNSIVAPIGAVLGVVVDANHNLVNAVITSQSILNATLASTSASTIGFYIINFASPTITGQVVGKGDVIYKVATNTAVVVGKFGFNTQATYQVVGATASQRYTWAQNDDGWVQLGTSWGGITGTLSNQTDLQTALNAKEPTITNLPVSKGGVGINSLTGQASKLLRVNSSATGYELFAPGASANSVKTIMEHQTVTGAYTWADFTLGSIRFTISQTNSTQGSYITLFFRNPEDNTARSMYYSGWRASFYNSAWAYDTFSTLSSVTSDFFISRYWNTSRNTYYSMDVRFWVANQNVNPNTFGNVFQVNVAYNNVTGTNTSVVVTLIGG